METKNIIYWPPFWNKVYGQRYHHLTKKTIKTVLLSLQ